MEKRSLIIAVVIVLVVFYGLFFVYKKSCQTEECFNDALYKCKPAKFYSYRNNNLYLFKISRSLFSECNLKVEVVKMAIGSEPDLVRLMEGKGMECKVPKDLVITLDKMENLLAYCHGELKEGLYQIMLERIYGLIVRDMSGIIKEAEKIMEI